VGPVDQDRLDSKLTDVGVVDVTAAATVADNSEKPSAVIIPFRQKQKAASAIDSGVMLPLLLLGVLAWAGLKR